MLRYRLWTAWFHAVRVPLCAAGILPCNGGGACSPQSNRPATYKNWGSE